MSAAVRLHARKGAVAASSSSSSSSSSSATAATTASSSSSSPTLYQYFLVTRPWSFTCTSSSLLTVVVFAHQAAPDLFSWPLVLLLWVVATQAHAIANLINTYFDFVTGFDDGKDADDRSLVDQHVRITDVRNLILTLLFTLTISTSYLAFLTYERVLAAPAYAFSSSSSFSPLAFFFSSSSATTPLTHVMSNFIFLVIAGASIGYVYTGPPYPLKHVAMGDICMLLAYGPICASFFFLCLTLQMPQWPHVFFFATNGFLTSGLLHANNTRDAKWDRQCGAWTLAIFLGETGARLYFIAIYCIPYVQMTVAALWPALFVLRNGKTLLSSSSSFSSTQSFASLSYTLSSLACLLPWITLPLALDLIQRFYARKFVDLCPRCGQFQFVFALVSTLALAISVSRK